MTINEMDVFISNYRIKLKTNSSEIQLTEEESIRKDKWALKYFGDTKYAFMFNVLVPNVAFAIRYGYKVAIL